MFYTPFWLRTFVGFECNKAMQLREERRSEHQKNIYIYILINKRVARGVWWGMINGWGWRLAVGLRFRQREVIENEKYHRKQTSLAQVFPINAFEFDSHSFNVWLYINICVYTCVYGIASHRHGQAWNYGGLK